MALLLQMVRGPGAEHARADDCDMVLHALLVGLRGRGRNGSGARPKEERAARYVQHRRQLSRALPSQPAAAEVAAEAGAEPGRSPRLRSPNHPGTSASLEAAEEEAEAVEAAASGLGRSSGEPSARSSAVGRSDSRSGRAGRAHG